MADGRWRLPVDARTGVDPGYLKLLLAYEDRRFYVHRGVDPLALGRAALQLMTRGHIVSGGSTITMQLARLMEPRRERSVYAKLRQMVRAIEIERQLSKEQILDLYLALAPFGGNLEGVRAASIAYFGKEPKRLSLAEVGAAGGAAAIAGNTPPRPLSRCRARRARPRARAHGRRSIAYPKRTRFRPRRSRCRGCASRCRSWRRIRPIGDGDDEGYAGHQADAGCGLQKMLEALARDRAIAQGPNISVAIIAVDNESGDVLARVGSSDYFDERRAGQVDMTRAVRSPGSTLKPFIYGLAFEDGFVHPESLIDDRPIRFGSYAPENFDMTFQGTVPVRKALQFSLNVPAIALLDRVGASRLSSRLKQAGGNLVLPKDEAPGLAMGLGGVGVTLAGSGAALCRSGAARHHKAAARDHAGERRARTDAADGSGRGLAGRQRPDRHAAAGKRRAQQDRVQDRHQLRLPRRLVGRLRWPHHHRRLGRASRWCAGGRPGRPHRRRADPVRCLRPHRQNRRPRCRRRRRARWSRATPNCRCRCAASARRRTGAYRQ